MKFYFNSKYLIAHEIVNVNDSRRQWAQDVMTTQPDILSLSR